MAAPPWTNSWNEASPSDSDAANTLGSNGRQLRFDIRQRMDWQHVWNQNTSDDGGHRNIVIATAYHTANQESFKASGFSLTGANAQSVLDLAGTWNTSGTPTAIKLALTDSGSNANSLLMDLQVNSSSKFSVSKTGVVKANGVTLGAGGLVQTVQSTITGFTNLTGSYVTMGSLSITPTSATNRVRIQGSFTLELVNSGAAATTVSIQVLRGASLVAEFKQVALWSIGGGATGFFDTTVPVDTIDSPATTGSITYNIQAKLAQGLSATFNNNVSTSTLTLSEIV